MTGGGFGGCVLALVDADRADAVDRRRSRDRTPTPPATFTAPTPAAPASHAHLSLRQPHPTHTAPAAQRDCHGESAPCVGGRPLLADG